MTNKVYAGKNTWNHDKNRNGIDLLFKYGLLQRTDTVDDADIIMYTSASPIASGRVEDIDIYDKRFSNKLILLGPHFSVFPTDYIKSLDSSVNGNIAFNLLSKWNIERWRKDLGEAHPLHLVAMPFPVDTEKFKPNVCNKTSVMIYTKRRSHNDYQFIIDYMNTKGYNTNVFNYESRYTEADYIDALQTASFGIWIGCHESQGFALEEALSCGVPLLVFNVKYMNQEVGQESNASYFEQAATTISYWDNRCGEFFHEKHEFFNKLDIFTRRLQSNEYNPREFILENLGPHGAFKRYWVPVLEDIKNRHNEDASCLSQLTG